MLEFIYAKTAITFLKIPKYYEQDCNIRYYVFLECRYVSLCIYAFLKLFLNFMIFLAEDISLYVSYAFSAP